MADQTPNTIDLTPQIPRRPKVRAVIHVTATHFGLTVDALTSASRKQPLVRPRQIAMYIAREVTGRSLPFIAGKVGRKDHTTVLHGIRSVTAKLAAGDAPTIEAVSAIAGKLGGANG